MSRDVVCIKNLSKIFVPPHPVINSLTVSLPTGGITGLVGPDGAGKTTLIRLIAGLLLPSSGSISIAGHDTVKEAELISSLIGYMPQRFGLYEDLTVMQNLVLYADLQGVTGNERATIFDKLLAFTGLRPFTGRKSRALSGGMKQKLGLACSLLRKPPLLLLDEPSVGVDPLSRRELWKMVSQLASEGISILWSTSYLDEAERCNQVLLLDKGTLQYQGTPAELTERVKGKVFSISGLGTDKRKILEYSLNQPYVIDGVIQGQDVRLVLERADCPFVPPAGQLKEIQPRFEDAFIDLLGGGPGGTSALAAALPPFDDVQEILVETTGLTKIFGTFVAANEISFSVKRGEIFGLLGPNGAGKSTTFKMMCGLLRPTRGKAIVNGIDLQAAPSQGRSFLGYMSQKFSLYGILSVRQNLEFFSSINNLTGKVQQEAIALMAEVFGFVDLLATTVDALPLGFKQRLALACAVMHRPKVLFLDEPTSGVDPITRREFWNHINGLVEKGATVVVTTHFMDEAEYCDRIALVYRGNVIRLGSPEELKALATTPSPTLEDAFISLIEQYEEAHAT